MSTISLTKLLSVPPKKDGASLPSLECGAGLSDSFKTEYIEAAVCVLKIGHNRACGFLPAVSRKSQLGKDKL